MRPCRKRVIPEERRKQRHEIHPERASLSATGSSGVAPVSMIRR
jgi:hypothetical protein